MTSSSMNFHGNQVSSVSIGVGRGLDPAVVGYGITFRVKISFFFAFLVLFGAAVVCGGVKTPPYFPPLPEAKNS